MGLLIVTQGVRRSLMLRLDPNVVAGLRCRLNEDVRIPIAVRGTGVRSCSITTSVPDPTAMSLTPTEIDDVTLGEDEWVTRELSLSLQRDVGHPLWVQILAEAGDAAQVATFSVQIEPEDSRARR